MKVGQKVYVDRCYFTNKYRFGGFEFSPWQVPMLVIKEDSAVCDLAECRSTCSKTAFWLRSHDKQRVWVELREKGFRGATWNYDAHKVCTSFIHEVE